MRVDLENYLREMKIPFTEWDFLHNGETIWIDSEDVIELIANCNDAQNSVFFNELRDLLFVESLMIEYLKGIAEKMATGNI